MQGGSELARLEEFVDKLLTRYNELKQAHQALKNTLAERDRECSDLKEKVAELTSERATVGSKVADLIGRIEQWESEEAGTDAEGDAENGDSSGVQGTLFDREAEPT